MAAQQLINFKGNKGTLSQLFYKQIAKVIHPKAIKWNEKHPKVEGTICSFFFSNCNMKWQANILCFSIASEGVFHAYGSTGLRDQSETSHSTACWQTLLLERPPDCWMTASVVLSGCETLTLTGGGGGGVQRKDGDRPASPVLPPALPPALSSLLSLAVDVTMPNHLSTSGQGRRPQQKKMEGEFSD